MKASRTSLLTYWHKLVLEVKHLKDHTVSTLRSFDWWCYLIDMHVRRKLLVKLLSVLLFFFVFLFFGKMERISNGRDVKKQEEVTNCGLSYYTYQNPALYSITSNSTWASNSFSGVTLKLKKNTCQGKTNKLKYLCL